MVMLLRHVPSLISSFILGSFHISVCFLLSLCWVIIFDHPCRWEYFTIPFIFIYISIASSISTLFAPAPLTDCSGHSGWVLVCVGWRRCCFSGCCFIPGVGWWVFAVVGFLPVVWSYPFSGFAQCSSVDPSIIGYDKLQGGDLCFWLLLSGGVILGRSPTCGRAPHDHCFYVFAPVLFLVVDSLELFSCTGGTSAHSFATSQHIYPKYVQLVWLWTQFFSQ